MRGSKGGIDREEESQWQAVEKKVHTKGGRERKRDQSLAILIQFLTRNVRKKYIYTESQSDKRGD